MLQLFSLKIQKTDIVITKYNVIYSNNNHSLFRYLNNSRNNYVRRNKLLNLKKMIK